MRAYRNAARSIGELGSDVTALMQRGTTLTDIPGIGEDLEKKIQEIIETGKCEFLERLHEEIPPAIRELLKVPGLGPKRVKLLWHALHIHTLEQLLQAAQEGQIQPAARLRRKNRAEDHRDGAGSAEPGAPLQARGRRSVRRSADPCSLRKVTGVDQVTVAGSFRRMRETVGDLDIVVTAESGDAVMDRFVTDKEVKEVLAHGPTRSSVLLKIGLQVDLRVVPNESYGAALVYFTGSKAHNIAIRRIAQNKGLKLNEYGVFKDDKRIAGETEESVYTAIGLPWIPPELREDSGEIQAALAGEAPKKPAPSVRGRK